MSYYDENNLTYHSTFAADAPVDARTDFIRKTYLHLAGAILAFAGIEAAIFSLVNVDAVLQPLMTGRLSWLVVLGLFMVASWIAESWARSATSVALQYAGLSLYVVAEAIIFVPLLYVAELYGGAGVIGSAAIITLAMFGALTSIAFITRKDFSFLRGILVIASFAAFAAIICSFFMPFTLGVVFSILMIALACGYILYYTSNVIHHYRIGQHVAASLALFASVALLFWYVLRLLMALQRR